MRSALSCDQNIDRLDCQCCGTALHLSELEKKTIDCMFTGEPLVRTCGVIFGPARLLTCSEEDLSELYAAFYKFGAEGDGIAGQEKTFYLLNPSIHDEVLNFACGDWSRGAKRLVALGWNVTG